MTIQENNTCTCDHEKEINRQVNILYQQLLEFNKKTFEEFMRKLNRDYEERINTNKKLHSEIDEKRLKLQEVERILEFIKF